MRPVDKQKVRQVYSDRHETCTLLFQLFEIYNFEDYGVQSLQGSAASRHIGLSYAFNLMAELDFVAELLTTRSRMELSYYCGPVARNSCWAILKMEQIEAYYRCNTVSRVLPLGVCGQYRPVLPTFSGCGTSRERLDAVILKVVDLKKLE